MAQETKCPIWRTPAQEEPSSGDYRIIRSERAGGIYKITGTAEINGNAGCILWENAHKITTWLEDQRKSGERLPTLTADIVDRIAAKPPLNVIERTKRALRYIASQAPSLGETIRFAGIMDEKVKGWQNGALIATESRETSELGAIVKHLADREYLKSNSSNSYYISVEGWDHLEKLNNETSSSEQVFVAMWFDQSVADAYTHGIAPAIEECGYRPMRIDGKEHINKIDDEIIAEIRRSKFLVADFTAHAGQPRGGVYFEAGFAFGLNKPVIWTCRLDRINEVHFDTRQYNHITWETPEELRTKLRNRIGAVIGDGPLKGRLS